MLSPSAAPSSKLNRETARMLLGCAEQLQKTYSWKIHAPICERPYKRVSIDLTEVTGAVCFRTELTVRRVSSPRSSARRRRSHVPIRTEVSHCDGRSPADGLCEHARSTVRHLGACHALFRELPAEELVREREKRRVKDRLQQYAQGLLWRLPHKVRYE